MRDGTENAAGERKIQRPQHRKRQTANLTTPRTCHSTPAAPHYPRPPDNSPAAASILTIKPKSTPKIKEKPLPRKRSTPEKLPSKNPRPREM